MWWSNKIIEFKTSETGSNSVRVWPRVKLCTSQRGVVRRWLEGGIGERRWNCRGAIMQDVGSGRYNRFPGVPMWWFLRREGSKNKSRIPDGRGVVVYRVSLRLTNLLVFRLKLRFFFFLNASKNFDGLFRPMQFSELLFFKNKILLT